MHYETDANLWRAAPQGSGHVSSIAHLFALSLVCQYSEVLIRFKRLLRIFPCRFLVLIISSFPQSSKYSRYPDLWGSRYVLTPFSGLAYPDGECRKWLARDMRKRILVPSLLAVCLATSGGATMGGIGRAVTARNSSPSNVASPLTLWYTNFPPKITTTLPTTYSPPATFSRSFEGPPNVPGPPGRPRSPGEIDAPPGYPRSPGEVDIRPGDKVSSIPGEIQVYRPGEQMAYHPSETYELHPDAYARYRPGETVQWHLDGSAERYTPGETVQWRNGETRVFTPGSVNDWLFPQTPTNQGGR